MFDSIPKEDIDVLIATDCISEGQNLQDCDYLINYDIHWNPLYALFSVSIVLEAAIRLLSLSISALMQCWTITSILKAKVETCMKIVDMIATGDDNLLSDE